MRREFASLAASKGLSFAVDTPHECVHSDPALVGQLLRNLLSNAIKYTPQGRVELRCARHGDAVDIEVRDSGVGIDTDQLPLIFDEFYQVGVSPNSSRDGYGLGLSIVQRIARLLGIAVKVESQPGKGSVFSFRLPSAQALESTTAASTPARDTEQAQRGGAEILLVEDEPGVRNAMRMLLKLEGYHLTVAASYEDALAELRHGKHFDLIVTDYHLDGGRTGTEVITASRDTLGNSVKAILVTGDTSSAVREMQGDAGLRITSKPINSDELLALVRELVAA
jgi:two-component system CheB/CheR fusion protein